MRNLFPAFALLALCAPVFAQTEAPPAAASDFPKENIEEKISKQDSPRETPKTAPAKAEAIADQEVHKAPAAKAEAKAEPKPKAEAKAEPKPEPKAVVEAAEPEAKPEPKPEPKPVERARPMKKAEAPKPKELTPCAQAFVPLADSYKKAYEDMTKWIADVDAQTAAATDKVQKLQDQIQANEGAITKAKLEGDSNKERDLNRDNKQLWTDLNAAKKDKAALCAGFARDAVQKAKDFASQASEKAQEIKSSLK